MFTKAIAKALVIVLTVGMTSLFLQPVAAFIQSDSLTLSTSTYAEALGETSTANSPVVTASFLATSLADTFSVTAYLVSAPAGNSRLPVLRLIETTSAIVYNSSISAPLGLGATINSGTAAKISSKGGFPIAVSARFQLYIDTPEKNGSYVIRVVPTILSDGTMGSAAQTITITVGAVTQPQDPPPVIPADTSQIVAPVETSTSDTYTVSMSLNSTLVKQLTSTQRTQVELGVNLRLASMNPGDTASVSAYLVSAPTGNVSLPKIELVQTTNGNIGASPKLDTPVTLGTTFSQYAAYLSAVSSPGNAIASFKLYLDNPKKTGVYVIRVTPGIENGGGSAPAKGLNVYIVVEPNPDTYPVRAEAIISKPGDITNKSDAEITAPSGFNPIAEVAVIRVKLFSLNGSEVVLDSLTATISGAGAIGTAPLSTNIDTYGLGTIREIAVGNAITVYSDGTPGVGVISIRTAYGQVLATKSVSFVDVSSQASAILALSFSSFPEKGSLVTLTGLVNLPGTVRFTNNGKTLGSCARVAATGSPRTAVCQWKPPISGSVNIVARFTPTDQAISAITTTKVLAIGRRSGKR